MIGSGSERRGQTGGPTSSLQTKSQPTTMMDDGGAGLTSLWFALRPENQQQSDAASGLSALRSYAWRETKSSVNEKRTTQPLAPMRRAC